MVELAQVDATIAFLSDWSDGGLDDRKGAYCGDATVPGLNTREGWPQSLASVIGALKAIAASPPERRREHEPDDPRRVRRERRGMRRVSAGRPML